MKHKASVNNEKDKTSDGDKKINKGEGEDSLIECYIGIFLK